MADIGDPPDEPQDAVGEEQGEDELGPDYAGLEGGDAEEGDPEAPPPASASGRSEAQDPSIPGEDVPPTPTSQQQEQPALQLPNDGGSQRRPGKPSGGPNTPDSRGDAGTPLSARADGGGVGDKYDGMSADELRQELRRMQQDHKEQMNAEERARLELEDMLLRIEKHFKAEKAARTKAEQLMQQAIEAEVALKAQLEEQQSRFKDVDNAIEADREALQQERSALEHMRMDFEAELSAAQHEVSLAQDALKTAEDRVRAAEQVEKQKIIADYEQRLQSLTMEMLRMREEMQQRTVYMQREMQRYQATAMATAQAMAAAKKEVGERRKEIDATRTKMDNLMERLYMGHEHNLTLQANITTAQDHAGQLFTDNFMMNMLGAMALPDPGMFSTMGMLDSIPSQFQPASTRLGASLNKARAAPRAKQPPPVPEGFVPIPPTMNFTLPPITMPKGPTASRLHQPTAATKAKRSQVKPKRPAVDDRFHGSKARNDNLMAAAMANW